VVLEIDAKYSLLAIADLSEARYKLLLKKELREFTLQPRGRDIDFLVMSLQRVS
jgi:hypothetical protein